MAIIELVGGIIIVLTVIAIVKGFEVRFVLLTSGTLMAAIAGNPMEAFNAFRNAMTNVALVPVITIAIGFTYILKVTGSDKHLIHVLARPLSKLQRVLIPGTIFVTAVTNIALTPAAGVSAAVGAILIPILINSGVHPVMAASAVMAGTFGVSMGPGFVHSIWVAGTAEVAVMDVVSVVAPKSIVSLVVVAMSLTIISIILKEDKGYVCTNTTYNAGPFKVNPLKAAAPLFPLVLIVFCGFSVPLAMLLGVVLATVIAWMDPQEVVRQFFCEMGRAYAELIGIIMGATVFTAGMATIGITDALIGAMQSSGSPVTVRAAALFVPFVLAALSGSADATIIAFNEAVTVNAHLFGTDIITLGTLASIGGLLGRTMSPVVGAALVCVSLAKVDSSVNISPMDLTKRNCIGMGLAAVVCMIIFARP